METIAKIRRDYHVEKKGIKQIARERCVSRIRYERSFVKTKWSFDTSARSHATASWMRIGRTWRNFYPTTLSGRFEAALRFCRFFRSCQLGVMRAVMRACVVMRASGPISKAAGFRKPMCRWSLIPVKRISLTGARSKPQSTVRYFV